MNNYFIKRENIVNYLIQCKFFLIIKIHIDKLEIICIQIILHLLLINHYKLNSQ